LKVSLAIGGWTEGSDRYSTMAAGVATRKIFVESVLQFLLKHKFDGLDLDWEYPGEKISFYVLLAISRLAFLKFSDF
jgi:chitinase